VARAPAGGSRVRAIRPAVDTFNIVAANLDGSNPHTIAGGYDDPSGVAVSPG